MDGGVHRVPVDLIPLEQRVSFLEALNELPNPLPAVETGSAPLPAAVKMLETTDVATERSGPNDLSLQAYSSIV